MPMLLTGAGVPVGASFDPASILGYVDSPYSFAVLRAAGKLWQDAAKTVPAVANTDPVRVAVCGATDWTAPTDASRPLLYDEGDGKWSLLFDGSNDCLDFSGIAPSPLSVHAAVRTTTAAVTQALIAGPSGSQKFKAADGGFMVGGKEGVFNWAASSAGVTANVNYTAGLNYGSTGAAVYWKDGVTAGVASANVASAGFTTNLTRMGRTTSGGEPWSGRIRGLVLYAASLTDAEIETLHAYLGSL